MEGPADALPRPEDRPEHLESAQRPSAAPRYTMAVKENQQQQMQPRLFISTLIPLIKAVQVDSFQKHCNVILSTAMSHGKRAKLASKNNGFSPRRQLLPPLAEFSFALVCFLVIYALVEFTNKYFK